MSDARERLRRYLEQRRELGESELVLDGMSVEQALAMLSATGPLKRRERGAEPTGAPAAPSASATASTPTTATGEGEGRRGSALPTAFRPEPADADEEADEPVEEAADATGVDAAGVGAPSDDAGAPADHPRLRGAGAPGVQDLPPAAPGWRPEMAERQGPRDVPEAVTGDWRAVLGAAGGDDAMATRDTRKTKDERTAATNAAAGASSGIVPGQPFPGTETPVGLVVGAAADDMFGGPLAHLDTLDAIASTVRACTRCPLYQTATHGVPGEGNPDADFMVVGEAPGADEDASGRPFVGASGQLLTKILAAINLRREDVFIANVVKHRPPGNRNPAPDEVAACSPYLVRQIELVRPKVILTVGNFAVQTLLDTKLGIGKLRGLVHLYHGVPLVATYHPAALLRNPTWKRPTWEDVQLARRLLDRATAR